MSAAAYKNGYSADVQMQLDANGRSFSIGQLGPDFLILRDPADYPPTNADITLIIDGRQQRWTVYLPHGIRAADGWTQIGTARSA